jgi:hypothetical protein
MRRRRIFAASGMPAASGFETGTDRARTLDYNFPILSTNQSRGFLS